MDRLEIVLGALNVAQAEEEKRQELVQEEGRKQKELQRAAKRINDEAEAERSRTIRSILDTIRCLVEAGIKQDLYHRGKKIGSGFFGQTVEVDEPSLNAYGWTVGYLEWSLQYHSSVGVRGGERTETKKMPTAIDKEGRLHPCERPDVWADVRDTTRGSKFRFGVQSLDIDDLKRIHKTLILRLPS